MLTITRCIFELVTPMHCGGGEENGFDLPVTRDAFGVYRIPGASIAGILREYAQKLSSQTGVSADEAFGFSSEDGPSPDQQGRSSCIWCSDAKLLDYDGTFAMNKVLNGQEVAISCGPFIREHVRIDLDRGTGVEGGKFDEEYVPAGMRFALEITLDGWTDKAPDTYRKMFVELCAAIQAGHVRFGGKAAEGFGKIRCLCMQCRRFDLECTDDLAAWLVLSDSPLFSDAGGTEIKIPAHTADPVALNGISGMLCLPLASLGPLLVGGGTMTGSEMSDSTVNACGEEADILFYSEPYFTYDGKLQVQRYIVPGSSFRGVLRGRVYRVARDLGVPEQKAVDCINSIFGWACSGGGKGGQPGKIRVYDAPLESRRTVTVHHVCIDRFTGGTIDGALYAEEPIWDADLCLCLNIDFSGLDSVETALLFHALLDITQGHIPVGAGGNRGNGYLTMQKTWGDLTAEEFTLYDRRRKLLVNDLFGSSPGLWEELDAALTHWRERHA